MSMQADNLKIYESAMAALEIQPDDVTQKHAAVLALARAGSLDFALSEYMRLELNKIRHHEDAIALGGRLYKDLYLSHQGKPAREFARLSAETYEKAYQDTSGFYSGLNAATMAFLGGVPEEVITSRAQRILDELRNVPDGDVYFKEASRAEAYYLLGDKDKAWSSLRRAIDFDPLNFTAHASTLKQFAMIARQRDEDATWLSEFKPPRAVQFAGHIFGREGEVKDIPVLSDTAIETLYSQILDTLQSNDIGFGFGALAAGSDILIAEALLEEGGELHVTLPVDESSFVNASVKPFGDSWVARFKSCLSQASSVTVFDDFQTWPDHMLQHRASLTAMGGAIRRSRSLEVDAGQLLIWDEKSGSQGTAFDANLWRDSKRPQFVIPYTWPRNAKAHGKPSTTYKYQTVLNSSGAETPLIFDDLITGIKAAIETRMKMPGVKQNLSMKLIEHAGAGAVHMRASTIESQALPGAINLCELAANYVAVHHDQAFTTDFMGLSGDGQRVFALKERG